MNWKRIFRGWGEPAIVIHNHLVRLENLTKDQLDLWADFQRYLAAERERKLPQLLDSIRERRVLQFELGSGSRIVETRYANNPLCSFGSIAKPPGGRFNFGPISSYYETFQALYFASDYQTAFSEKFPPSEGIESPQLTDEQFALADSTSFVHSKLKAKLSNVLDLRDRHSLDEFAKIVCEIRAPEIFLQRARDLDYRGFGTIPSAELLLESILSKNYEQSCFLLDQPSNSQWLAHYVRKAGLQGIVYPSVRNLGGFNVAVFPENITDSFDSQVSLLDPSTLVESKFMIMNATNVSLFMSQSSQLHLFN